MNLDDIKIPDIEKIALEARTTSRAVANVLVATNRFLKKREKKRLTIANHLFPNSVDTDFSDWPQPRDSE